MLSTAIKMKSLQRASSKISFSLPLDTSSVLYRQQSVSLYSEDFGAGEFLLGKICIRNSEIRWTCPQEQLSDSLKLKSLYRQMKEGNGLLVVEEAIHLLKTTAGITLEVENLIYLNTGLKKIFVLFHDWEIMDKWTSDLLVILNDLGCESMAMTDNDNEKAWIFDMSFKRMAEDEFEVKITLFDLKSQYITIKSMLNTCSFNLEEHICEIVQASGKNIDAIGNQLIEIYIVNCLREAVAESLVKDILSPYSKKMVFSSENAVELFTHCAQWYGTIEKKHKADQISEQLDAIAACKVRDPLLICFRLLELQKFTLQNNLRKISLSFLNKTETNPIQERLSEIMKQRDEANSRANLQLPLSGNDCSCNCIVF